MASLGRDELDDHAPVFGHCPAPQGADLRHLLAAAAQLGIPTKPEPHTPTPSPLLATKSSLHTPTNSSSPPRLEWSPSWTPKNATLPSVDELPTPPPAQGSTGGVTAVGDMVNSASAGGGTPAASAATPAGARVSRGDKMQRMLLLSSSPEPPRPRFLEPLSSPRARGDDHAILADGTAQHPSPATSSHADSQNEAGAVRKLNATTVAMAWLHNQAGPARIMREYTTNENAIMPLIDRGQITPFRLSAQDRLREGLMSARTLRRRVQRAREIESAAATDVSSDNATLASTQQATLEDLTGEGSQATLQTDIKPEPLLAGCADLHTIQIRQVNPRYWGDAPSLDMYTPRAVRGHGAAREALCPLCTAHKWLRTRKSVYWSHMQFVHGIDCQTRRPYPPPALYGMPNTALDSCGFCERCKTWVRLSGRKNVNQPTPRWFRHSYECRRRHATCVEDIAPAVNGLLNFTSPLTSVAGRAADATNGNA